MSDINERENFELFSIQLTEKYAAVYADDPGADGFSEVFSEPLDAIGLAKSVIAVFDGGRLVRSHEPTVEVVGLVLYSNGEWHIVNEDVNFCGIGRAGDPIKSVDWYRQMRKYPERPDELPPADDAETQAATRKEIGPNE